MSFWVKASWLVRLACEWKESTELVETIFVAAIAFHSLMLNSNSSCAPSPTSGSLVALGNKRLNEGFITKP